ncbi:MAG: hypothetical protein DVB23_003061 [Verrucomicrobia bacterium]|jgi:hypothetical protein|nr:MAG: hypothetical protein DVB23_003061 [Verrucomicrobiota bacterium]
MIFVFDTNVWVSILRGQMGCAGRPAADPRIGGAQYGEGGVAFRRESQRQARTKQKIFMQVDCAIASRRKRSSLAEASIPIGAVCGPPRPLIRRFEVDHLFPEINLRKSAKSVDDLCSPSPSRPGIQDAFLTGIPMRETECGPSRVATQQGRKLGDCENAEKIFRFAEGNGPAAR